MTLSALPDVPWNDGPKQECLTRGGITMSHDELAVMLGDAYQKIIDAGFVMVPRNWRQEVCEALSGRSANSTTDQSCCDSSRTDMR